MTDRDRLIELIEEAENSPEKTCPHYLEADCFDCPYDRGEDCDNVARKADYLLANGVIVPPCKVGDKVYYINTFYQKNPIIIKCEVDALHITSGKNRIGHKKPSYALIINENMKSLSTRVYFENFGKTVFLTREEAEKVLRESENNA